MFLYAKLKETRLNGRLFPADTTFTVTNADDLPVLDVGEYFILYVKQGIWSETMYCTNVSGTTFTVTRAREGTSAIRFNDNALIEIHVTPDSFEVDAGGGGAVDSVNGQTGIVVLDADDISTTGTTNKFTTAGDISKLAGIESGADVTNASNVTAALNGATMTGVTINADNNTVTNIDNNEIKSAAGIALNKLAATTASKALVSDASGFIVPATATAAEIDYLVGVSSGIQGQLNGKQASDAELSALAGLTSAADKLPYFTGSGTAALADLSSAMRTFMTTPSSANLRSLLSDETGTGVVYFKDGDIGTPSAGNIKNCTTDICYASRTSNQTITTSTVTVVAMDYEAYDTNTMHDTSTNNSRITIKTAGKYYVQAYAHWGSNNTGLRQAYIKLNGTSFPVTDTIDAALVTGQDTQNIATILNLAVNDYVELVVWQNSGGDLALNCDSLVNNASGLIVFRVS
jgi:hypothetical protein